MLASKPPQAPALAVPATQTTTASYHPNAPQRPAMSTKSPDAVAFTSPTKSEFSDGQNELAAVR